MEIILLDSVLQLPATITIIDPHDARTVINSQSASYSYCKICLHRKLKRCSDRPVRCRRLSKCIEYFDQINIKRGGGEKINRTPILCTRPLLDVFV